MRVLLANHGKPYQDEVHKILEEGSISAIVLPGKGRSVIVTKNERTANRISHQLENCSLSGKAGDFPVLSSDLTIEGVMVWLQKSGSDCFRLNRLRGAFINERRAQAA